MKNKINITEEMVKKEYQKRINALGMDIEITVKQRKKGRHGNYAHPDTTTSEKIWNILVEGRKTRKDYPRQNKAIWVAENFNGVSIFFEVDDDVVAEILEGTKQLLTENARKFCIEQLYKMSRMEKDFCKICKIETPHFVSVDEMSCEEWCCAKCFLEKYNMMIEK